MFDLHRRTTALIVVALVAAFVSGGAAAVVFRESSSDKAAAPTVQGSGSSNPGNGPKSDKPNDNGNKGDDTNKTFSIAGTSPTLFPGAVKDITLTLTNPNNQPIKVTSVTIQSVSTQTAACSASNVTGDAFNGSVLVPKNGTATVTTKLRMNPNAPNACQGATFALSFKGTGQQS